jgi:hypothetical protein
LSNPVSPRLTAILITIPPTINEKTALAGGFFIYGCITIPPTINEKTALAGGFFIYGCAGSLLLTRLCLFSLFNRENTGKTQFISGGL